jgi:plastocyanin
MKNFHRLPHAALITLILSSALSSAQQKTITAAVAVMHGSKVKARDSGNVVLWLTPAEGTPLVPTPVSDPSTRPRLVQKNKSFEPHVLVVRVGSLVQFPNRDPFFHNVFSLFEGKRFDLGLYEAGSTRDVLFDKPGISYIFCNIHAEMSAVVIALNTPYYGVSDMRGQVLIPNVAPGRYILHVWYEGALPETLNTMTKEVTISDTTSTLGLLRLPAVHVPQEHKNLYGRDYTPPAPASPTYEHP